MDAENVNLVISLEVPWKRDVYLHRVGRAGRFGVFRLYHIYPHISNPVFSIPTLLFRELRSLYTAGLGCRQ